MSKAKLVWKKKAEKKDFEGALAYLSLVHSQAKAAKLVHALRLAKGKKHTAKDLLRASALPLLERDEPHVAADLERIYKGKSLPPVLLIRGDATRGVPMTVADGYHRICAICFFDENAPVACCLV
jgi:hypothetical protein